MRRKKTDMLLKEAFFMTITHVDHVLIAVPDLDEAAEQYAKLGFHVTEGGTHPGRGTANRLVVLESGYLELISIQDREAAWPELVRHWDRYGFGFFTFAFASDDLDADVDRFKSRTAAGITSLKVEEIQEGALETPGGKRRGWRSALVSGGNINPFLIQHDSTGADLRNRLFGDRPPQAHPIGYGRIDRLEVVFPSLAEGESYFRDGYGLQRVGEQSVCPSRQGDRVFFPLAVGQLEVIAPNSPDSPLHEFVSRRGHGLRGVLLTVPDPDAAASDLEARGIRFTRSPISGAVTIDPAEALGARLVLVKG
jgi:4-hydroxyphenylpyruvate dioxygenase-like putative hemolysin